MVSTMRIKRNLPPAPEPTRDRKNPKKHSIGIPIRKQSPVKGFGDEKVKERVRICCEQRRKKASEKHKKVLELGMQGKTKEEIAAAVGYSISTVENIIGAMRSEGYDIPYQYQKGRKRRCKK